MGRLLGAAWLSACGSVGLAAEALRTGDVEIDGSTPAVKRFLGVLPAAA